MAKNSSWVRDFFARYHVGCHSGRRRAQCVEGYHRHALMVVLGSKGQFLDLYQGLLGPQLGLSIHKLAQLSKSSAFFSFNSTFFPIGPCSFW